MLFESAPLTVWRAITQIEHEGRRRNRRYRLPDMWESLRYHAQVWWGGVAVTLAALLAAWLLQGPVVLASTRLEMQPPPEGSTTRLDHNDVLVQRLVATAIGALDSPTARLMALHAAGWKLVFPDLSPDRPIDTPEALRRLTQQQSLQVAPDGLGIIVAAWHRNPAAAKALDDALVAAVLAHQTDDPTDLPADFRPGLRANRARLTAELQAADHRAASLSQSLTDLARDMVSALKSTDNRSVSTEVSDQGAALLAELQLKRVQLGSKYQDGYPALSALDDEITKLRSVVAGEQRRSSVVRSAANPVFLALGEERKRVGAELDTLNARRDGLRGQIAAIDRQFSGQISPGAPEMSERPKLSAGVMLLTSGADPRFISLPMIITVGTLGTFLLQWLLMRQRSALVTPVEAELILGVPVLRCLDGDGVSTRAVEPPAWTLPGR
jgi:hypothetical protein